MENFIPLIFDLLTLLADTYKIYLKNVRLMAFIAALVISLHTVLYLLNVFSVKSLITDLITEQSYLILVTPGTPEFTNLLIGMQKDIKIYAGVEWIFLLIIAVASLFLAISTTHASALIHGGKKISIKDLLLRAVRSLKRPFVTCFYITLFGLGYIFLCLVTLLPLVLILGSEVTSPVFAIPLSISAMVFYTYLSVVWNLSLVISVLEETFGIEALGKAAQIVKGMKLQGFILNLLLTILPLLLLQCLRLIMLKQSEAIRIVITLLLLNSIWMVGMFGHTAYTVFYYQCKKTHGEEVELQADMEYTKIPTAPPINENIP